MLLSIAHALTINCESSIEGATTVTIQFPNALSDSETAIYNYFNRIQLTLRYLDVVDWGENELVLEFKELLQPMTKTNIPFSVANSGVEFGIKTHQGEDFNCISTDQTADVIATIEEGFQEANEDPQPAAFF